MRTRVSGVAVCVIGFFVLCMGPAWATRLNQEEGIWPNHSADWVRTLNRFASTDADAAFYNPAGLAFMKKKGLHIQYTNQTVHAERASSQDYWGIAIPGNAGLTNVIQNPLLNKMSGIPNQYTAQTTSPVLPSADIVWNGKNYAVYLDIAVTQAAPGLTFKQGLPIMDFAEYAPVETVSKTLGAPTTISQYLRKNSAKRTEYYVAGTIGASYAFLDWMSAALGFRYIYAQGEQSLTVKNLGMTDSVGAVAFLDANIAPTEFPWYVDTTVKGHGEGLILGMHFKPIDIIDIGLKYEYYFPMVLQKKNKKFIASWSSMASGQLNIFLDNWATGMIMYNLLYGAYPGAQQLVNYIPQMQTDDVRSVKDKLAVTYPQTISLGFSIKIIKNLRAETSGELSLRPFAKQDGREKNYNMGYRVGQSLEWEFVPNYFVSVGYLYTDYGIKKTRRNEVDQLLTNHTIGGGFKLEPIEYIDIQVGAFYVFYKPEIQKRAHQITWVTSITEHYFRKRFEEKRWSVSLGVTAHVFGDKAVKKDDKGQI
jgi:long-chain fatty acid transport protein